MPQHKVVVGLGFGDEGKGTIVDFLAHENIEYMYVVRFSGGPQAAHNVITDNGSHHTFAQFGSGTFQACGTILSRFMSVNPLNLIKEAEVLREKLTWDPLDFLYISKNSLLILPWHQGFNRLQEVRRGDAAHGSCGQGIGVAQKFAVDYPELAPRMGDLLLDRDSFVAKLMIVWELLKAEYGMPTSKERTAIQKTPEEILFRSAGNLESMYRLLMSDYVLMIISDEYIANMIGSFSCIFEGSQGALLDEWKGFHPYTTWSTTTSQNALTLLSEADVTDEDIEVIGVSRTYHTRYGYGPFPTDETALLERFPEPHNNPGKFQGAWRVGAFDTALFKYAVDINPRIDSLAFTHMDYDRVPVNYSGNFHLSTLTGSLEDQEKITHELLVNYYSPSKMELYTKDVAVLASQVAQKDLSILFHGPRTGDKVRVA